MAERRMTNDAIDIGSPMTNVGHQKSNPSSRYSEMPPATMATPQNMKRLKVSFSCVLPGTVSRLVETSRIRSAKTASTAMMGR